MGRLYHAREGGSKVGIYAWPWHRSINSTFQGDRRCVFDEHGEIVTTEPCGGVGLAKAPRQCRSHDAQQFVAGRVPEAVVDHHEVVEVQEEDADVLVISLPSCLIL